MEVGFSGAGVGLGDRRCRGEVVWVSRGGGGGFCETEVMKASVVEEGVEELPGGGDV